MGTDSEWTLGRSQQQPDWASRLTEWARKPACPSRQERVRTPRRCRAKRNHRLARRRSPAPPAYGKIPTHTRS